MPQLFDGMSKKRRAQTIAVDLGSRKTKAVLMERHGERYVLTRYALLDAPVQDKKLSPEQLGGHFRQVAEALGNSTKSLSATLNLADAVVRQVEMPPIPVDEMRNILKMNHKGYFQQDLPDNSFDCYVIPPRVEPPPAPVAGQVPAPAAPMGGLKFKVLAAAAKQQLVAEFIQAATVAGLSPDWLVPALVCPVNAFEMAAPEVFAKETVALVDIGFKYTSVCVVDRGELLTNRVINIGGYQITRALAEAKGITYAEADGIKIGMAAEVEAELQTQVGPLGREIRASLDFFEHQYERTVSQIYLSGGTTRSEVITGMLHSEIVVDCQFWNPTGFLQLALPGQQAMEIEQAAPQLTVAIGAALAAL